MIYKINIYNCIQFAIMEMYISDDNGERDSI